MFPPPPYLPRHGVLLLSLEVWSVWGWPCTRSVLTKGPVPPPEPIALAVSLSPFSPSFNPGNEVMSCTNFACLITLPVQGSGTSRCYQGILALWCSVTPLLISCEVLEELSTLGQHDFQVRVGVGDLCQGLLLHGPQTFLGRGLKMERRRGVVRYTEIGIPQV